MTRTELVTNCLLTNMCFVFGGHTLITNVKHGITTLISLVSMYFSGGKDTAMHLIWCLFSVVCLNAPSLCLSCSQICWTHYLPHKLKLYYLSLCPVAVIRIVLYWFRETFAGRKDATGESCKSHISKAIVKKAQTLFPVTFLSGFVVLWPLWSGITDQPGNRQEKEYGGKESVSVCRHLHSFRKHSIASYCDLHFVVLAGELEAADTFDAFMLAVCLPCSFCICVRTAHIDTSKGPVYRCPTAFFSFCDCN